MKMYVKKYQDLTLNELYEILKLRVSIFVVEQNCPYQEIDGKDTNAIHVFLKDDDGIQAYLRVLDRGMTFDAVSLGRVISVKRRCGLGTRILKEGIRIAKEEYKADKIVIEAQTYAKKFYENQGFIQTSEEFLEDGIPHIQMTLDC